MFSFLVLQADLEEDRRVTEYTTRTQKDKICIYSLRSAINIVIITLLALGAWAIFEATKLSLQVQKLLSIVEYEFFTANWKYEFQINKGFFPYLLIQIANWVTDAWFSYA